MPNQIDALVFHEARGNAFVDDIALLEEQLPRGHRGADDRDNKQHDFAELASVRHLRNQEIMRQFAHRRMHDQEYGHE